MGERKVTYLLGESFEKGAPIAKNIRYSISVYSEHLCSFNVDTLKYVYVKPFGHDTWAFSAIRKGALIMKGIKGESKYA
jgi:hypothetical protein